MDYRFLLLSGSRVIRHLSTRHESDKSYFKLLKTGVLIDLRLWLQ